MRDPHPLVRPVPLRPAGQHAPLSSGDKGDLGSHGDVVWEEVVLRVVARWLDLLSCVCLVLLECNVFCLTQTAFLSI